MMVTEKPDPWPRAQEALFDVVRAWVREEDPQDAAEQSMDILKEINDTPGVPFVFVCEMARVLAETVAKYMTALNEDLPTRNELLREIDILEMEYLEELVLSEQDENDPAASAEG